MEDDVVSDGDNGNRAGEPSQDANDTLNAASLDSLFEDDGRNDSMGQMSTGDVEHPKTRGHLLQKHKVEWRAIRTEIEKLKHQSAKLSKKDLKGKEVKRLLTKQIQKLKTDMEARQKDELDKFDRSTEINDAFTMTVAGSLGKAFQ
eukprot:ANDGO_00761.mRNA.1 hypothetical protein ACA1_053420